MSKKASIKNNIDGDLYLSFYNNSDYNNDNAHGKIVEVLKEILVTDFNEVYSNPNDGEYVFKLSRPKLSNGEEIKIFFEKLDNIFSECSAFTPHFTSYTD